MDLTEDTNGTVKVTVNWTSSDGDSADFYLINITTNAPQTPYGELLNIITAIVTQYELTGFMTGYEYNITVRGVNCGSQEGSASEPLTIRAQGVYSYGHRMINIGSIIIRLTHVNVWESIGKPCSCIQFLKKLYFLLQVTRESVSVLQIT